jgi:protein-S-isoprenylcysteine O-methyltransferase Ste14
MYPFLIWMYARLAKAEEKETRARFGVAFDDYAGKVPAFLPSLKTPESNAA